MVKSPFLFTYFAFLFLIFPSQSQASPQVCRDDPTYLYLQKSCQNIKDDLYDSRTNCEHMFSPLSEELIERCCDSCKGLKLLFPTTIPDSQEVNNCEALSKPERVEAIGGHFARNFPMCQVRLIRDTRINSSLPTLNETIVFLNRNQNDCNVNNFNPKVDLSGDAQYLGASKAVVDTLYYLTADKMEFYKPYRSLDIIYEFHGVSTTYFSGYVSDGRTSKGEIPFPASFTFNKGTEIVQIQDDQGNFWINYAAFSPMPATMIERILNKKWTMIFPDSWKIIRQKLEDDLVILPIDMYGNWLHISYFELPASFRFIWYKTCKETEKKVDKDEGIITIMVVLLLIGMCFIPAGLLYIYSRRKTFFTIGANFTIQDDELSEL